jgi:hypothetical protein
VNCYEYWNGQVNYTIPVAGAMTEPDGFYKITSFSPNRTYACEAHHVDFEKEWYKEMTDEDYQQNPDDLELIIFAENERESRVGINFTLDSGVIYGWVMDVGGPIFDPDHNSVAVLLFYNYSGFRSLEPLKISKTDPSGFYAFHGLHSGEYDVVIMEWYISERDSFGKEVYETWNYMYYPAEENRLTVFYLEDTAPVNFFLNNRGGVISGRVTDSSVPVPNQRITAVGDAYGYRYQAWSDSTGNYTLDDLYPDNYNLTIGVGADWTFGNGERDGSKNNVWFASHTTQLPDRSGYYSYMRAEEIDVPPASEFTDVDWEIDPIPDILLVNDNGWYNHSYGASNVYSDAQDYIEKHKNILTDMGYDYVEWSFGSTSIADTREDGYLNWTNTLNNPKFDHDPDDDPEYQDGTHYREWPVVRLRHEFPSRH